MDRGDVNLLEVLTAASSQHCSVLKPAEQCLKEWETNPGFHSSLLSIFSNYSVPPQVRTLAVLYLKNGIDRFWRKTAPHAISENEKKFIRENLICKFEEPVPQIALQLSVLISKIARVDCPRDWPDLIPKLLSAVHSEQVLVQQRSLLVLYHVVKVLSSKRLINDRRVFNDLSVNIFAFLIQSWNNLMEGFLKTVSSGNVTDTNSLMTHIDHCILTLKVLRKLVVFGFMEPDSHESVEQFLNISFVWLENFLKGKIQLSNIASGLLVKREKIITLLMKLLIDVQETHSTLFIHHILPSLQFVIRYNFTEEGSDLLYERFIILSMNLVRNILKCELYKPSKNDKANQNAVSLESHAIISSFFTASNLREISHRLVYHYFPLTPKELQDWHEDIEEFVSGEGGDSWKYSLRPCIENFYLMLFKEFRQMLTPIVLEMIKNMQSPTDMTSLQQVLSNDAVYTVAGLSSFDLYDDIDFDQWLLNNLILEFKSSHTNSAIIRRRVIWLIGCWVGVKLSDDLRPRVYEIILSLLSPQENLVVRLEAANTLRFTVDDFNFKMEQFSKYLEPAFSLLFNLLKDLPQCELKMSVLHVMSVLIERSGIQIRPHATDLLKYIPGLWEESADHNMLRCSILSTLVNLVFGFGALSVSMHEFLLPMIALSIDLSLDPHVYLLDDGLELWSMTLQCCPNITQQLLDLYRPMPQLFELGGDVLKNCLEITECYIILAPGQFLNCYLTGLVDALSSLLSELRDDGLVRVYQVVELILKVEPEQSPSAMINLLQHVYKSLIAFQDYPMVLSMYMSLFFRLIVSNSNFFWEFMHHLAGLMHETTDQLVGCFIDKVTDGIDNLTEADRRKLAGLALSSLLSSKMLFVSEKFDSVVYACVQILHDVSNPNEQGVQVDSLLIEDSGLSEDEREIPHAFRLREIACRDPVHSQSLIDTFNCNLQICKQNFGEEQFRSLWENLDSEIIEQLCDFIKF